MVTIERVQSGVRMERRLLKVLKGLAEYLDLSLGDLLEGIVLHAFEQKLPFDDATVAAIERSGRSTVRPHGADSHSLQEQSDVERQVSEHREVRRVRLTGTIDIALPAKEAFELFTPKWRANLAHEWDPILPKSCR